MSESTSLETQAAMTQVIGSAAGGHGGEMVLGEIESAGISVGWNRATLSDRAREALHQILERNGGVMDRSFELRHLESPTPLNPLGAKGAGEGGIVAVGGAVANAVARALQPLGVEITELPLSVDNLARAIRKARRSH